MNEVSVVRPTALVGLHPSDPSAQFPRSINLGSANLTGFSIDANTSIYSPQMRAYLEKTANESPYRLIFEAKACLASQGLAQGLTRTMQRRASLVTAIEFTHIEKLS